MVANEPISESANISVGSHNKTNSAKVRDYKVQPTWDGENKNPESLAEEVRNKTSQKHDINANSESYGSNVLEATNEVDNAKRASATASSRLLLPAPLESQGQETPGLGENGPTAPSRTTRRQKAVVSYTEPNLRDKMRRPTGDFIDAVGNRRTRRSSNAQAVGVNAIDDAEIPSYTADSGGLGIADKDRESLVNPLGGPISMVSQRKRRTLPAKEDTSHPSASEDGRGSNVIYGDMTNDNNVTPMVKGGSGGKGRGIHAAKRTPTELEHPESSDHALGEGSSHEELETDQSSKRLPFSVVDARRIKRGQRTAARRRSMMV